MSIHKVPSLSHAAYIKLRRVICSFHAVRGFHRSTPLQTLRRKLQPYGHDCHRHIEVTKLRRIALQPHILPAPLTSVHRRVTDESHSSSSPCLDDHSHHIVERASCRDFFATYYIAKLVKSDSVLLLWLRFRLRFRFWIWIRIWIRIWVRIWIWIRIRIRVRVRMTSTM